MQTAQFDPIEELRPLLARELEETPWEEHDGQTSQPLCFDAYRVGDSLHIDFDVPGILPELIGITVENHVLQVSVECELPNRGADIIERGRVHGRFKRSVLLPASWDVDYLTASVENGVLSICAPWKAPTANRSIKVTSASSSWTIDAEALNHDDGDQFVLGR